MKQIKELENKEDLEKTNKKLIEGHADEIATKQAEITKLEGEKATLDEKLKKKKNIKGNFENKTIGIK